MERTLKEIKELVNIIPGNIVLYYLQKDGLKRLFYSKSMVSLAGCSEEEYAQIVQQDAMKSIDEGDRKIIKAKLTECIKEHKDVDLLYRMYNKLKGSIWVHTNAKVIGELDGAPVILATLFDVSHEMNNSALLLEASDRAIVVIDKQDKNVLYANEKFLATADAEASEVLNRPCYEVVCRTGEWLEDSCTCFKAAASPEPLEVYNEQTDTYFVISARELLWGEHQAVAFYMSDVTAERRKDLELAKKNEQLHQIQVEAIHAYQRQVDAVMRYNPEAISTFQINVTKNRCRNGVGNYETMVNLQRGGAIDSFFRDARRYIPQWEIAQVEKYLPTAASLLESFAAGRNAVHIDCHYLVKPGDERFVRTTVAMARNPVSGDVEGVIYVMDNTRRELYANIIKRLLALRYESVALINAETKTYMLMKFSGTNELDLNQKPVDYDEVVRSFNSQLLSAEEKEEHIRQASLAEVIRQLDSHASYSILLPVLETGEKKRLKRISYFYLDEAHRSILSLIEDITDITEKERQRIEEVEKAMLAVAQATEAKTAFFANASHDMRTPLNGVLGFTQLAQKATTLAEKDECLEKIRVSGAFLLQLINDTLDLSKMESGRMTLYPEPCAGNELVKDIIYSVEQTAKAAQLEFVVTYNAEREHYVFVDRLRLQQLLVNLLGNAIKFTKPGGRVDFIIEYDEHAVAGEPNYKVTIRDTGVGMKKEFLPHAFEAFSQQDGNASHKSMGTGLGLAIVKQIVELMHGRIEVDSTEGVGTEFRIYLHLDIVNATGHPVQPVKQLATLKGKRALLCENHPINRELACRLLKEKGMLVETAENGRLGVERFSSSAEGYYDVVLMDIRMPEMDGLTATRKLRALARKDAKTVPIIAMTANAFADDVQASLAAGMNGHLSKPIVPQKLFAAIAKNLTAKQ